MNRQDTEDKDGQKRNEKQEEKLEAGTFSGSDFLAFMPFPPLFLSLSLSTATYLPDPILLLFVGWYVSRFLESNVGDPSCRHLLYWIGK